MTDTTKAASDEAKMTLAPGVVDKIIALAVSEVEGVTQVGSQQANLLQKFSQKQPTAGIETETDDDGKLRVTLHVDVQYGYVLPDLAAKIRKAVAEALRVQAGKDVSSIDVYIDGIRFEKD